MLRILCVALAACAALACGKRGDIWDEPFETDGPVAAAERLVWLNRTASLLTILTPGEAELRSLETIPQPRAIAASPFGVLVLGGRADAPLLQIVSLPDGAARSIPLGAAWDAIAVSPDGNHAILRFDPEMRPPAGAPPVRNLNEIGIVDLVGGSAETIVLQTESLVPREVVFAPASDLAAILFDSAVAFVDASAPARRLQVPLKLRDGRALQPTEAIFSPDGSFLFVRALGSDDVLALELLAGPDRIDVSINFLFAAGARSLRDIAVSAPFGNAVVALYENQVALLDARGESGASRSAPLGSRVDRILDLGDGLLLLHADLRGLSVDRQPSRPGSRWRDRLAVDRPRAAAGERTARGRRQRLPAAERRRDRGSHGGEGGTGSGPSPPELQTLQLAGQPTAAAADEVRGIVYLGLDLESFGGEDETATGGIAAIAAGSLASGGLLVDAPVRQLGMVGDWIFGVHDAEHGDVTLAPAGALRRDEAIRYEGVFLNGLLDRGEN